MVKRRRKVVVEAVSKKVKRIATPSVKLEVKKEQFPDIEDIPNVFTLAKEDDEKVDDLIGKMPPNWRQLYNEVVYMRGKVVAPVDNMGCERIPDGITPFLSKSDPKTFRFQLLVSLMLSSQTKDEVINDAMKKLHYGLRERGHVKGLTLESAMTLGDDELDQYIGKVGFHNRKTVYIKKACSMLQQQFEGDIPKTIEGIVSLPGVGPKMGYLLLQRGWNINDGIGVDVHLHRLAMMWGWVQKNNNPEITRKQLQQWLPRKFWGEINPLLVGFGQAICTPQFKNCDICTLGRKKLCKAVDRKMINRGLTDERIKKLGGNRGDVMELVDLMQEKKEKEATGGTVEQTIKLETIKSETVKETIKQEQLNRE